MAHALHEQRTNNSTVDMFDKVSSITTDPEIINLAMPFSKQHSRKYDPADLEDRSNTKLRELINTNAAGGHFIDPPEEKLSPSNVIDPVAALKKSLAESTEASPPSSERKAKKPNWTL